MYCIFSPAEEGTVRVAQDTVLLGCPVVKVDENYFLRLTFTFCQQIVWC